MMKTEKRKANVGERILITEATEAQGNYGNGDVSTVVEIGVFGESGTVRVREHSRPIYASEYEVIIETHPVPKKSARITALEKQVAELQAKVEALEATAKFPNTARFERESAVESEAMNGILADIKRKAKSPNGQRADVINRAKAFVDGLLSDKPVKRRIVFNVNAEKRTVVALFYSFDTHPATVEAKGIAKCDPDDVFNADIGKAIALARALGVEVPNEFVKAVQPTEVVVGQRIWYTSTYPNLLVIAKPSKDRDGISIGLAREYSRSNRILDDTDAVYE